MMLVFFKNIYLLSVIDNTDPLQGDQGTNPFLQENMSALDSIPNSEMLKDMADTVASVGEPSLSSLGLGGWSPVGLVQQCLELVHVYGDVSWCASIVLVTVCFRLLVLPLTIRASANAAKLNNIRPEIEEIQAKMRELRNSQDSVAGAALVAQMKHLYKKHDCNPFKVWRLFNWKKVNKMSNTEYFWKSIFLSKFQVLNLLFSVKYFEMTKCHRICM